MSWELLIYGNHHPKHPEWSWSHWDDAYDCHDIWAVIWVVPSVTVLLSWLDLAQSLDISWCCQTLAVWSIRAPSNPCWLLMVTVLHSWNMNQLSGSASKPIQSCSAAQLQPLQVKMSTDRAEALSANVFFCHFCRYMFRSGCLLMQFIQDTFSSR